jgi:monoamine oxidase
MNPDRFDTIVLGGGIAGLSCARMLAQAGQRVVLLEAQQRLGGRILTVNAGGVPIELGAEFVHGKPPALLQLLKEAGLEIFAPTEKFLHAEEGVIQDPAGNSSDADEDDSFDALDHLPASADHDQPFSEAARQMHLPEEQLHWLTRYVEGFNAADSTLISAAALKKQQLAEEAIDGESSSKPVLGYSALIDFLAHECAKLGVDVRLAHPVREILWRTGETVAICDADEFHATRCVVAIPLGVLLGGNVQFQPEPEETFAALRQMEMGPAVRISLLFQSRFWDSKFSDMSFLIDGSADLTAWWTVNPAPAPLLTGWAGGPRARKFKTAEQMLESALHALAKFFQRSEADLRDELVSWHTHDWQADPWSQGAYSYVRNGGLKTLPQLATPVDDALYFAGEHTDQEGHWGTVHAALTSGQRAASQILAAGKNSHGRESQLQQA